MLAEPSGTPSSQRIHYAKVGEKGSNSAQPVPKEHQGHVGRDEHSRRSIRRKHQHLERACPQLKFLV